MKLGLLFAGLFAAVAVAACTSPSEGLDSAGQAEGVKTPAERVETGIVFPQGTSFTKRDCTLTLRWNGGGNDVKVAGEFTGWADGAIPMTRVGDHHEVTLAPGSNLQPGQLYGYKIVTDGNWRLDPQNAFRKIIGGQMNSALRLPQCSAGPEILSGKVEASGSGSMKVHVDVRGSASGAAVEGLKASLDNEALPKGSFTVNGAGVDFSFTGLPKGKHTLALTALGAEEVDLPFWIENEAFDYRDGILYMLLIDRFANGDKTTDRPIGNPVHYDADWHGGDLQGALDVMKTGYFEKLGVRTIWLSPLNTQTSNWHFGDGGQKYSAYHGYWPIKSREVEPRFGGDAALHAFVQEAHKRGLRVLLDLINNQVHDDHEYVSSNPDWFRRSCKCGDDGCGWSQRPFDCMFQPYLPDINWQSAGAEKQFVGDAVNWISQFDLDGFRVDAVKHVESNSVYNMRTELTRRFEQGGARIFMVGETAVGEHDRGEFFGEQFGSGFEWIDAYTGSNALDGQFDFPTRHNMADGLVNGDKPLNEVDGELRKSEARYGAKGKHHVRFLNGHDNPRIASIAAKDSKLGCSWSSGCRDDQLPPAAYDAPEVYSRLKRALTVLYSMPGVPYLYQGDEVAFPGGGDPDMRRDMLFGEGLDGLQMTKPGAQPRALNAKQVELREWVRQLGEARKSSKALRRGERKTLIAEGDLWVYAYEADGETAIVAINRGGWDQERTVNINGSFAAVGDGLAAAADGGTKLTIRANGAAVFLGR